MPLDSFFMWLCGSLFNQSLWMNLWVIFNALLLLVLQWIVVYRYNLIYFFTSSLEACFLQEKLMDQRVNVYVIVLGIAKFTSIVLNHFLFLVIINIKKGRFFYSPTNTVHCKVLSFLLIWKIKIGSKCCFICISHIISKVDTFACSKDYFVFLCL